MPTLDAVIALDFKKGAGLLPAIVQDHRSGKVLMLAYINRASWEKTLESGEAHYWSRSRGEIWHKGGTSGHVQKIREIYVDCDNDTVLLRVEQVGGAACHTGYESCFYRQISAEGRATTVGKKVFDPERVYRK
jgi:phosphoribosyl-AMP cyclohydrolase